MFSCILDELLEMHLRKGADYGTAKDPLANLRSAEEFDVPPSKLAILRCNEKMSRLKTWCKTGVLSNEGVDDTLKDLASCAILAAILLREERAKGCKGK